MDVRKIKELIIRYRTALIKKKIKPDVIILFGSYAKGKQKSQSDIDIAIVSRNFGKDRFKEGLLLNKIAQTIDTRIEVIPISLKEYMKPETLSPILHEIRTTGTVLF